MKKYSLLLLLLCSVLIGSLTSSSQRNQFVFSQLRYRGGDWDPYPSSYRQIAHFMMSTTSLTFADERRKVTLMSDTLFDSPFLCMTGHGQFNALGDAEIENLKRYLNGGGLLFIDDSLGAKNFGFDKAVRNLLNTLFPDKRLSKIPADHAVFRSFYLISEVGGRRIVNNYLEGIMLDGRLAVIYSQNDLLGAWARDKAGNWLNECIPGGEIQRLEAMKLTANIIMFSVTGTYKTDAIHQEYIRQKLKR